MPSNSLIFDLGCHSGQDSDFYLKKGFTVVAVEANPPLCDRLKQRFAGEIAQNRFILVEKAIAKQAGEIEFYVHSEESIRGTTIVEFGDQTAKGSKWTTIVVPSTTLSSIIGEYGVPRYLKIDIEGADLICLESLASLSDAPAFISIERPPSFSQQLRGLELLNDLGYNMFKFSNQRSVMAQTPPRPALEGVYTEYQFEFGASGLFGEELPGSWLTYNRALAHNASLYLRSKGLGVSRRTPLLKKFTIGRGAWYDIHATRVT
jgi:FkbM family methyltransferase